MQITVNKKIYEIPDLPDRPLVWILRDEIGLKGTKFSCEIGICGTCTIQLDGVATRACITPLSAVQGRKIVTIEGLNQSDPAVDGTYHPVQQAFLDEQVPQCGWCMPAQMLTAAALLANNPNPTPPEIRQGMSAVYCRCGAYDRIRKAVAWAAEQATPGSLS